MTKLFEDEEMFSLNCEKCEFEIKRKVKEWKASGRFSCPGCGAICEAENFEEAFNFMNQSTDKIDQKLTFKIKF